jgi:hypothetical protein
MDVVQAMEQTSRPGCVHMSAEFCDALRMGGSDFLIAEEQLDGSAFLAAETSAMRLGSPNSTSPVPREA